MTLRVQIVCNPKSGDFSAKRVRSIGRAYAAHGFDAVFAESSATCRYEPLPGADRICVAGGDGTVRHVLARLAQEPHMPPIDIYPAGTINLLARERGMPRDVTAFVEKALATRDHHLHPVALNDTWFMACASIGPDARAVDNVSPNLKRAIGRLAYGVALIGIAFNWQRPKITVRDANGVFDCEALYIANGRYFAGPWSVAPQARLDDPLLHVVALKTARRRDFIVFMIATALGRAHRLSNVHTSTSGALAVIADQPHVIQADGDIVSKLPAEIRINTVSIPA